MSNTFKLDDIIAKANEDYGHFPVEISEGDSFVLRNVLQLSEAERAEFTSEKEGDDESTALERMRKQIRVTADDKEAAERLIEKVGENLAVLVTLIKQYNEATQAGEA